MIKKRYKLATMIYVFLVILAQIILIPFLLLFFFFNQINTRNKNENKIQTV